MGKLEKIIGGIAISIAAALLESAVTRAVYDSRPQEQTPAAPHAHNNVNDYMQRGIFQIADDKITVYRDTLSDHIIYASSIEDGAGEPLVQLIRDERRNSHGHFQPRQLKTLLEGVEHIDNEPGISAEDIRAYQR